MQTFRTSGFFSVFKKSIKTWIKKKYTIWNSYLYKFKVKIKLRNSLNKSKTYTIGKMKKWNGKKQLRVGGITYVIAETQQVPQSGPLNQIKVDNIT